MAELERALAALAAVSSTAAGGAGAPPERRQQEQQQQQQQQVCAAQGIALYKLYKVYREAQAVYRLKDATSRFSDFPHLAADLVALADPAMSPGAKLALHARMLRTYAVLQP
jgi:hypothetical protein